MIDAYILLKFVLLIVSAADTLYAFAIFNGVVAINPYITQCVASGLSAGLRFQKISDYILVPELAMSLASPPPSEPLPAILSEARLLPVMAKGNGEWQIVVYHNIGIKAQRRRT